tara:strand:+ start:501 stop:1145 length:645 start_codon:yes stop_codon:yes gene_type:complete
MKTATWYFDFLSPYAYLQSAIISELAVKFSLKVKPVLFAALLNHNGQLGPAEIPGKREFVFKQSLWLAKRHGITMRLPPAHPFNPLPPLRLATALDGDIDKIKEIFNFIWKDGGNIDDQNEFVALGKRLSLDEPLKIIGKERIKSRLKEETAEAISRGVFGVPAISVDDEIFWGFDSSDFMLDYLNNSEEIKNSIIKPAKSLSVGIFQRNTGRG